MESVIIALIDVADYVYRKKPRGWTKMLTKIDLELDRAMQKWAKGK